MVISTAIRQNRYRKDLVDKGMFLKLVYGALIIPTPDGRVNGKRRGNTPGSSLSATPKVTFFRYYIRSVDWVIPNPGKPPVFYREKTESEIPISA